MSKISTSKWLLLFIVAAIYIILNIKTVSAASSKDEGIPSWVSWEDKSVKTADSATFELSDKHVVLKDAKGKILWECNKDYLVQDGFVTNIDKKGGEELILLLWKRGRYGTDRPFWVKGDEETYSQHICIYSIEDGGKVSPKWFASDIGRLAKRVKLMEKDSSVLLVEDIDGNCTLWRWESFGLKNIENEVKFIVFGDNIIHRNIYEYAGMQEKGSFDFLYEPFKDEVKSADIAAIAAETTLVDKASAVSGYPRFGSPIAVGDAIKKAGFDVTVCANNHALDKGIYGVDVSTAFFEENGITCVGIQNSKDTDYRPYETISKNGIKFALFSYTYGTNDIDISDKYPYAVHYLPETDKEKELFVKEIESAGDEADFIVVFVHWGEEYSKEISESQKEITQLLAKAGADVVIGTHPHVVQDTEVMDRPDGGKLLVYYSLGNFRADQGRSEDTRVGAEAVFFVEHAYDGVRLKDYDTLQINAYWRE